MPLIRPEQRVEGEPVQELAFGQRILDEVSGLRAEIQDLKHTQEMVSVKLLGGVDEDTKHGRLPAVESSVEDLQARVKVLETRDVRWRAYAAAAAAIGGAMGAVASSLIRAGEALMR